MSSGWFDGRLTVSSTQPLQPTQPVTNTVAILGLIFGFLFWPAGLILSIIGLNNVKKKGAEGKGLAIAGLIVSVLAAVTSVVLIAYLIFEVNAATTAVTQLGSSLTTPDTQASQDVTLGAPVAGTIAGVVGVPLTVVNSGTGTASYTVTVAAVSADGKTQYDQKAVFIQSLAAGQTATDSAEIYYPGGLPTTAVFKVTNVVRALDQ